MDKANFIEFLNKFSSILGTEGMLILSPKQEVIYSHFNSTDPQANSKKVITRSLEHLREKIEQIDIGKYENMLIQGESEKILIHQGDHKRFKVVLKGTPQLDVTHARKTIDAFLAALEME